ncbi:MAG: N-acetylmuramoyl-L-alanine amidase [Bacteroidetes bacterium]|nr:N-acetylmuramoyl-L-alanine amidase [Bacteroidota bacterium]
MIRYVLFLSLILGLFTSCAPKRVNSTVKNYERTIDSVVKVIVLKPDTTRLIFDSIPESSAYTSNFGLRKPNYIIIHHTAQDSCAQTLRTFAKPESQVSAHYLICKDGTVYHLLNDYLRAWHAGAARWGTNRDINSSSIGIELDNNGRDSFPKVQIHSLLALLDTLSKEYQIPASNYLGHADVAPGRKFDPSALFPWRILADSGYGYWYPDTNRVIPDSLRVEPAIALKVIGYDVSNLPAAILSFRLHFLGSNKTGPLSPEEMNVLYAVMQQYL